MSRKASDELLEDTIEEINEVETVIDTVEEKPVILYKLVSKADHTIPILENGQRKFIPPFGEIEVDKNSVVVEYDEDANFLVFVKK